MAWDVPNPKGRVACFVCTVVWSLLLVMVMLRGQWGLTELLFALLFLLLLALSLLRVYQEWVERGEWLE
jgi:hypothetical protein